jgi:hypothetical protein
MKKIAVAMIAVAGLAAVANAQPFSGQGRMSLQVATDPAGPWSSSITVLPGTHVYVRQWNSWTSNDPVYGWASTTLEEVSFNGANATDTFQVLERPQNSVENRTNTDITPASGYTLWKRQGTTAAWNVYNTATGVKLDHAVNPDTTGRLVTGQSTFAIPGVPWQGMDRNNGVVGFLYRFVAGTAVGSRNIDITARFWRSATPAPEGNQFVVYVNEAGTNTKFTTDAALDGARVTIIPAPASLALLGLGGLIAGRRRR